MKVLCVVAHPDDEVIGVGGTLAKHAEAGHEVRVCVLAQTGVSRAEEITPEVEARQRSRRDATQRACDRLGVRSVRFHDFPENEFDAVPLIDLVQTVEAEIDDFAPDVIYTHHYGDLNISHELTCRAVGTAARPLPESTVSRVLGFETLSSTEWATPDGRTDFSPTSFVDVSAHLDTKLAALEEHEGELRPHPHPRNVDNVRRNAMLWGAKAGLEAAEPFVLLREIR